VRFDVRVTFNPNVARVTPIRRVLPKYSARSAEKIDDQDESAFEAVSITISPEAHARALKEKEERERREGKRGFWNAVVKAVAG